MLKVFAYCSARYEEATRRAAGVEPLCCPPVTAETLDLALLEGNDLLFFNTHGLRDVPALLGGEDGPPIALRAEQLGGVDLGGAVVFAESCYLGDEEHPMRDALLRAGAWVVIAGPGKNWGSVDHRLFGADILGMWLRRLLAAGMTVEQAFRLARWRVRFSAVKSRSARDALGFRLFRPTLRQHFERGLGDEDWSDLL